MQLDRWKLVLSALLWGCLQDGVVAQSPSVRRPTPVTVQPRDFRFGIGLSGAIPNRAFKLKFVDETVLLWDLDGDGKLTPDAGDGLSLEGLPFIVELPGVLLLREGQFRVVGLEGSALELTSELTAEPVEWVARAATMTRLRIAHGKKPIRLDVQASNECVLHCNYLRLNPPEETKASSHDEDAGRAGYTDAGALAGRQSCIWKGADLAHAIEVNMATIWHSVPLMAPDVTAFGCTSAHGWCMIRPLGDVRRVPFVHPADGAESVPVGFAVGGELPNPVPGTEFARDCGHPVFAMLAGRRGRLVGVSLIDERGKQVTGTQSCPQAPANPDWPSNSDCAAFVPARPLEPGTRYTVTFGFEGGQQLAWQFRTRAVEGKRLAKWNYTPIADAIPIDVREFVGEAKRAPPAPAKLDSAPVIPAWVPPLQLGEIRVVQDPAGGWWCVHSRANDSGLLSLNAFGVGEVGRARAERFAEDLRSR